MVPPAHTTGNEDEWAKHVFLDMGGEIPQNGKAAGPDLPARAASALLYCVRLVIPLRQDAGCSVVTPLARELPSVGKGSAQINIGAPT